MIRILTLATAVAALSLASCAGMKKKECSSCCATKPAKKECCAKAEAAGKKCEVCAKGKAHQH